MPTLVALKPCLWTTLVCFVVALPLYWCIMSLLAISVIFNFLFHIRFPSFSSLAKTLRTKYNQCTLTTYRKLEGTYKKLGKAQQDLIFLRTCRTQQVFPKFLRFKLYKESLTHTQFYKSWQKTLLDKEIKEKHTLITNLTTTIQQLRTTLRTNTNFFDFHACSFLLHKTTNKYIAAIKTTHDKKLQAIGASPSVNACDPDRVIFNYSNITLSDRLKFLLSFGLDFGIPSPPKFIKHIVPFEILAGRLKHETTSQNSSFDEACAAIKQTASELYNKITTFGSSFLFKKSDYHLLKTLSSNKSIVITRPDKGKGVVILNRTDYNEKMQDILNDQTKFKPLPSDTDKHKLILKQEDQLNRFLRNLQKDGIITKEQHEYIHSSGAGLGIMYGLPKVHKQHIPLRPILAAYNTVSYKLAKFIVPLLEPLTANEYTIPNSYTFVDSLKNCQLPCPPVLASFDVTSLFTNIPLTETIDIICNTLFSNNSIFHNFDKPTFKKLLSFACSNMYFIFQNKIYQQTDGVAMGTPLGPTLANIFLCHHEQIWLQNCPSSFKPLFYKRYVDDTFLCFKQSDHIDSFLQYLNSQHPNINFTAERAIDNSLPFLDLAVSWENNSFTTNVYRKPTFTGLGTNFNSYIYSKFKINAIKTLIHRAFHLSSTYAGFHSEIEYLKQFFNKNGYPNYLIDRHISLFLNKIFEPKIKPVTVPKKSMYVSLPFYGSNSETIYNSLFKQLSACYPHINFTTILKTHMTIGKYFQFKDRLPPELCSSVIYKYTCRSCNALYIGSTGRRSVERFSEHRGVSFRTNRPLSNPSSSHIRNHAYENDHPIYKDNFSIIDSGPPSHLRIIESIYIKKFTPTINVQSTAASLFVTPAHLPGG